MPSLLHSFLHRKQNLIHGVPLAQRILEHPFQAHLHHARLGCIEPCLTRDSGRDELFQFASTRFSRFERLARKRFRRPARLTERGVRGGHFATAKIFGVRPIGSDEGTGELPIELSDKPSGKLLACMSAGKRGCPYLHGGLARDGRISGKNSHPGKRVNCRTRPGESNLSISSSFWRMHHSYKGSLGHGRRSRVATK
jgi:hypothetical protein